MSYRPHGLLAVAPDAVTIRVELVHVGTDDGDATGVLRTVAGPADAVDVFDVGRHARFVARVAVRCRFRSASDRYVRVHTGKGSNDSNDLYWGRGWYVWNNTGDRATLKNASGTVIDRCKYDGGGTLVNC